MTVGVVAMAEMIKIVVSFKVVHVWIVSGNGERCCVLHEERLSLTMRNSFMHVLTTSIILNRCDTRADPIDFSPASCSKASYRGYLGRGNRKVIPSCVVLEVCHWYPSPSGVCHWYPSPSGVFVTSPEVCH